MLSCQKSINKELKCRKTLLLVGSSLRDAGKIVEKGLSAQTDGSVHYLEAYKGNIPAPPGVINGVLSSTEATGGQKQSTFRLGENHRRSHLRPTHDGAPLILPPPHEGGDADSAMGSTSLCGVKRSVIRRCVQSSLTISKTSPSRSGFFSWRRLSLILAPASCDEAAALL